ncbi:ATP-binding protein [Angustibacter peucedani]
MTTPHAYSADDFQRLVARETDEVELKSGASAKKLQEAMVAFSNTAGGTIFIGVDDGRHVIGRQRDQGTDDVVHEAALSAHNVGRYRIYAGRVDARPIVAVEVDARLDEVAQTSDGRVLQRRGGRNVPVIGADLWALASSRTLRRYERSDSGLALDEVNDTVARRLAEAHGWPMNVPVVDRWVERGLATPSGHLTIAGALTLTDPAASLDAGKFHIDLRSYEADDTTSYVRREAIRGPVQDQVERATDWIVRDVGTELVVTGAFRHDVPRLPRRVVREAVANAVAHRDYTIDRTPIVIEVRPSAVTVRSPGSLPPPVTVDTLREAQAPRNHTVIDVLRKFGLAEDSGQGIDVMQDGMKYELLEEPEFTDGVDSFSVTLRLGGMVSVTERAWLAEYERRGALQPDERILLLTAAREDQLTNARAREALGVDSVEARNRLQRLRDAGLLDQHGQRGRAYYTLGVIGPERSLERVVLDVAASGAALTNQSVRELTGLDRVAARELLRRLVNEGRLIQEGVKRGTKYRAPTGG